jgi:hypothetical protein
LVGLVALAALAAGGITWAARDDAPYVAPTPEQSAQRPLPAEASAALQALETALADGDGDAAAALAPEGDPQAAELLRAVAANARSLGLVLDLRYVDEAGSVDASGRWAGAVAATWRFRGDASSDPSRAELDVQFVPADADRVAIAGFGRPGAGRVPAWLAGPVVVRRAPRVLVMVAGGGSLGRSEAERYAALASTSVKVVGRVLPDWRGRLVVEVPATSAALDRALDAEPGHSAGIAAVTAPADGSTDTDSPVHVFVNPEVFDRLQPTGAQVVLSHEAVHVATDAARSDVAPWLLEGFADYVALRDVDLPLDTTAGQIIRQVRREGAPQHLPGPDEFATGATHLGATYESAWLACVLLAERGGERALVKIYDEDADGGSLESALQQRFGFTEAGLTRRWQRRLADLVS